LRNWPSTMESRAAAKDSAELLMGAPYLARRRM
jgi:hypothetical protein